MSTQQQEQYWNAATTEDQQLNTGGPDTRASSLNQLKWKCLGRNHHYIWCPTRRRAIKEGSKGINRDWANN